MKNMAFKSLASSVIASSIALSLSMLSNVSMAVENDIFNQIPLHGAKIIARFNSTATGYRGVLAEMNGNKRLFYATPDNKYLIFGSIFDANGTNLSTTDLTRLPQLKNNSKGQSAQGLANQPAPEKEVRATLDDVWKAAQNASAVVEGAGPDVYIYFDPYCPHCHSLYDKTRQYVGKYRFNWIPVDGLGDDSTIMAGALIGNGMKPEYFHTLMKDKKALPKKMSPDIMKKIEYNRGAMAFTGSTEFPTILVGTGSGRKIILGNPTEDKLKQILEGAK